MEHLSFSKASYPVKVYPIDKIPRSVLQDLDDGYSFVSELLGLGETIDEQPDLDDYIGTVAEAQVPDALSNEIVDLLQSYSGDNIDPNEGAIEHRYTSDERTLSYLVHLRKLLAEQLEYIYLVEPEEKCKIWFIVASIDVIPRRAPILYGGVMVFWNPDTPDNLMMQGISKFFLPALYAHLYPEEDAELPRLNSLLIPAVEALARELGARRIYVVPIGKQGSILERYYGFQKTNNVIYPCKIIKGHRNVTYNPSRYTLYVKAVTEE